MTLYKCILVAMCLMFGGCAVGPFVLEHNHGELPKAKIELPEDKGKIKVRGKSKEVTFIWVKKF